MFFIIGEDNIAQLDEWHDLEGIFAQCTVVVGSAFRRGGGRRP